MNIATIAKDQTAHSARLVLKPSGGTPRKRDTRPKAGVEKKKFISSRIVLRPYHGGKNDEKEIHLYLKRGQ